MASCLVCSGPLPPKATKYCSRACCAIAFTKPPIACKNSKCGKLFQKQRPTQMFCCYACSTAAGKGRLPEEVRAKVLELRRQGMSIDDICRAMHLTQHSVKAILKRARMQGTVVGRRSSRPITTAPSARALVERRTEELPPSLRHILRERLAAGSEPLRSMHPISWGAIAL